MPVAATVNVVDVPEQAVRLAGFVVMDGGNSTVRVARSLVAIPHAFETTTSYEPASPATTGSSVSVAFVAPVRSAPPFLHWYEKGPPPDAATVNDVELPAQAVWLTGCVVTTGTVWTARVAAALVTEQPSPSVTTTS